MKNKLAISLSLIATLSACGESSTSTQGENFNSGGQSTIDTRFDEAKMIDNIVNNVILPSHQNLKTRLLSHQENIKTYCQNISTEAAESEREKAQQSWRLMMHAWQQVEMMQMAPLLDNSKALHNRIYTWSNNSKTQLTCSIDQDVVYHHNNEINGAAYDISKRGNSRRGIDSLEYLLFNDNLNHSCSADSVPVASWNTLDEQERREQRCNFANTVTSDLIDSVDVLINTWTQTPSYADLLLNTADASDHQDHQVINLFSNALFQLDTIVKDDKLARPLALINNACDNSPCGTLVESFYSHNSLNNLEANLLGFKALFNGAEGLGFDDFLITQGHSDTSESINQSIDKALITLATIKPNLAASVEGSTDQYASALQLHSDIKEVTDVLKTAFIVTLSLDLPSSSAGDND